MKKTLILFFTIIGLTLSAQQEAPPQGINYQAVVYSDNGNNQPGLNNPGQVLWNQDITMRFAVYQGEDNPTLIYQEMHAITTDEFGMVSLVIGQGVPEGTQLFETINWGGGSHFLRVDVDKNAGINFESMSYQKLWSVPYALHSEQSNSSNFSDSSDYSSSAGNGITGVIDNGDGTLTFNYYDGSSYTTAVLSGMQGPQGPAGADGIAGQDGLSAYDTWLAQGNTGTEADFLAGIQGPQGPTGNDGLDGTNGADGQSAYEIWLAQGNTGTEADFLNGITGPQGPAGTNGVDGVQGPIGPQGPNGNDGATGPPGPAGADGQDGLSAYEVWLSQGNTGTEADFLNGISGPQGPAGTNGIDGINGIDGQDGLSAYETWINQGNTGTEADFLNGITGPQGAGGNDGANGVDGMNGIDGQDGLSAYEIWLSQGNTGTEADFLTGITGPQGPTGADGAIGPQGDPGSLPNGSNNGDVLYWNGTDWVVLNAGQTGETLNMCYGVPTWGPCLAQIETSPIMNITGIEATSGGNVTNDGGSSVVARGVCWDINPSPDLTDSFTSDGTGTGTFNSTMLGLTPLTTYYVRAYATNSGGTTYGNELTFVSGADIPVVTTLNVNSIYFDSCVVDAEVLSNGGATVTERGVCYSTTPNPTVADNQVSNGAGLGTYSTSLTGLSGSSTYYVRSYATNSTGTAYGNELTFNVLTVPGVSCNSCGIAGNNLTSPLMVGGHIEANIGQSISMTQGKCCSTCYLSCAASSFINPPEANVLSYSCTNGTGSGITQVINFNIPGIYTVTGKAGNSTLKVCTVYIIVN